MSIGALNAINAYNKSAEMFKSSDIGGASDISDVQSFSSFVQSFMTDAGTALSESEKIAASSVNGKTDLTSIVLALDNAEIVLTQITAIRDKIITAYQTVLNSTI